ncbi:MAG: spore coat protein [Veillonellaceae bacterium]|nr:spore coat protein [Veillonellaceae bacterium]
MPLNFSQKEKMLLADQKNHEQICIQKYQSYASQAQDPQLKQLFSQLAQQEQTHLDTLNQISSGQVPSMSQGQQGQQSGQNQQSSMQSSAQSSASSSAQNNSQSASSMQNQASFPGYGTSSQGDATLCNDMLMTEKYVSSGYDTAIFEFTNAQVRQALNHIQKEEQQHGEKIFNYMQSKGMYNVQQ